MILIVDDDDAAADRLAEALAELGRNAIVCYDAEAADVVIEHSALELVLCDVRLTGPFRFEGLDLLDRAIRRGCSVVLVTAFATPELREEALRRGAVDMLEKPFAIEDLTRCLPPGSGDAGVDVLRAPRLDDVLSSGWIEPAYQPIVSVAEREPYGFEALTRSSTRTYWSRPELLFEYARRKGRVADLEIACLSQSIAGAAFVSAGAKLFMNVHPAALDDARFTRAVIDGATEHGRPLASFVLELTEQEPVRNREALVEVARTLRAAGVAFAFDDVGTAYSHLPLIDDVRPAYLKISQHFGMSFESDATRSKVVRSLVALSREFGAATIVEGVETERTADAARAFGIPLAQGYHFAPPMSGAAAAAWLREFPGKVVMRS